jgi:cation/acetate symporter
MIYSISPLSILIFIGFVLLTVIISLYFGRKANCPTGFFVAGGKIHWFVNGIAFAGEYLTAASLLGICGLIAMTGYDGFLYAIGYLAGWVVALFLIAEPFKKLGKYTFSDAIDSKFNSKAVRLTVAISTLIVTIFYLIPQMVGAGILITPLLGWSYKIGVLLVGLVVIIIVFTGGMASTTYIQFFKGAALLIFSVVLVGFLFNRGFSTDPKFQGKAEYHKFTKIKLNVLGSGLMQIVTDKYKAVDDMKNAPYLKESFIKLVHKKTKEESVWIIKENKSGYYLEETLYTTLLPNGDKLYNGAAPDKGRFYLVGHIEKLIANGQEIKETGRIGPLKFLEYFKESTIVLWGKSIIKDGVNTITIFYQRPLKGRDILRPGLSFKLESEDSSDRINFVSLMLALFLGVAALPHILIRYYTVSSLKCARRSTILAITVIGIFFILIFYLGLGAMTGGVINLANSNMSAPLLAKSFSGVLFSIISALVFVAILGTVSGLIITTTGVVVHDFFDEFMGMKMLDKKKLLVSKITAVCIGVFAIYLGMAFEGMNVTFLIGWAFAVAASANLPAIIMLLFWKRTTAAGVISSVFVGIVSSIGIILLSPDMYIRYGLLPSQAPIALNNPAIISIPLSFAVIILVSILTEPIKD